MRLDLNIHKNPLAKSFCKAFMSAPVEKRLILGRNTYGEAIARKVEIGGFVDDFTTETHFLDKPVIHSDGIPADALVVSSLLGKPVSGAKRLNEVGATHLDYFSFHDACGLNLPQQRFWGGFKKEFMKNRERFEWVCELLTDEESRSVFLDILSFRLSGNLDYMRRFTDRERHQYFEPFLDLKTNGETFVDAGGFDGYTSLEFIKRCPGYEQVHFFEPDESNMNIARARLDGYPNIQYHPVGLASFEGAVRFAPGGSIAAINDEGNETIRVDLLDAVVNGPASFIKMDIEGSEKDALGGAKSTIETSHPKLAIAAYHLDDDFWKIPEIILSVRDDYRVHLRHYTEGVAETVMFFVPE